MWRYAKFTLEGVRYEAEAKVFDNPSSWGLTEEGRISKFYLNRIDREDKHGRKYGDEVAQFERGWAFPEDGPKPGTPLRRAYLKAIRLLTK